MTIFFLNDTKVFIHYLYLPRDRELPLENYHAFVVEQGLAVEIPFQAITWASSVYLRDPDGRQIEITQKEK